MAGTRLHVRVMPGSATAGVAGRHDGGWKIRVREAADRGRANEAATELLARTLGLARRDVRLVAGHGARAKIFELTGLTADETDRRLTAAEREGVR